MEVIKVILAPSAIIITIAAVLVVVYLIALAIEALKRIFFH